MSTSHAKRASIKHLSHALKMEVKKQRRLTRVSIYAGPQADFTTAMWRKEAAKNGVGRPVART